MANHLTPEELSEELGLEREDVIRVCLEEGVPIYQGKIDKYLFQTQLEARRTRLPPRDYSRRQALLRAGVLRERMSRPSGRLSRSWRPCGPARRRRCGGAPP